MSSPQLIRLAARRRRRRAIVIAVSAGVVTVWVAVCLAGSGSDRRPRASAPSPAPSITYVGPQRWLALPVAGSTIDEIFPVRFPRSEPGAVATLVAKTETGWGLDPARATRAAAIYAAPWFSAQAQTKAAQLAVTFRHRLGVSEGGTDQAPTSAYAHAQVVGAQWQATSKGHVAVTVLVRVEAAAGADDIPRIWFTSTVGAMTWRGDVRGGDWVYGPVNASPPDPAAPGTAAFNAAGWTAIQGRTP